MRSRKIKHFEKGYIITVRFFSKQTGCFQMSPCGFHQGLSGNNKTKPQITCPFSMVCGFCFKPTAKTMVVKAVQQRECTKGHWSGRPKMVTMVTSGILYHKGKVNLQEATIIPNPSSRGRGRGRDKEWWPLFFRQSKWLSRASSTRPLSKALTLATFPVAWKEEKERLPGNILA